MAIYAIGDIHGHSLQLRTLLSEVKFQENDTIIFLGDYVDKGPDVAGTIELLIECAAQHSCIFIRGNHDQSLIEACDDSEKIDIWQCLAGEDPLGSYGKGSANEVLKRISDSHIHFLKKTCSNYYETHDFIFVHAGIRADYSPNKETIERLHWSSLSLACPHFSGKTVICGHSAQSSGNIADLGHTICVDTAITKNQYLSCLNLDNFSYTQVAHNLDIRKGQLR